MSDKTEQLNNSCLNYSKLQLSSTCFVFVTCFPSHSSHYSSIVQPQTPSPRTPFKAESSVLLIPIIFYTCACSIVQLCLTLCDPMDCHPPGSSVHGILQARILGWIAMSSSRGSSQPRDQTFVSFVSCIAGRFFFIIEPSDKPFYTYFFN